jgi:hypothetical protein
VFIVIFSVILYFVPTVIAFVRRREVSHFGTVLVINFLTGWTLIGWVAALAMAVRSRPATQLVFMASPPGWGPQQQEGFVPTNPRQPPGWPPQQQPPGWAQQQPPPGWTQPYPPELQPPGQ